MNNLELIALPVHSSPQQSILFVRTIVSLLNVKTNKGGRTLERRMAHMEIGFCLLAVALAVLFATLRSDMMTLRSDMMTLRSDMMTLHSDVMTKLDEILHPSKVAVAEPLHG